MTAGGRDGVAVTRVRGVRELEKAWSVLGCAYEPPLWDRMEDYSTYLAKVAEHAVTLVVCRDGRLLGGISFYANDLAGGEAFVTQLMVVPQAQGMGLGRLLLSECERLSTEVGMRAIALEVRADNGRARHLYDRAGFKVCGHTERGGILMGKRIGPSAEDGAM